MLQKVKSDKQSLVSVENATEIIFSLCRDYGSERIDFNYSVGRVLAHNVYSDIDFPPYDRITMDGIAIKHVGFLNGIRQFRIKGVQGAGDSFVEIDSPDECVEVMTGASLPESTDTVIRFEDLQIENGIARITVENIRKGQNIHRKGEDRKRGDVVAEGNQMISPATIAVLASSGNTNIEVKKLPSIIIVSTGNEVIDANQIPGPFEIRNSNMHVIASALHKFGVTPATIHLRDDEKNILGKLEAALNSYDVLVLTGGVSKGKFDFIPQSLEQLGVKKLFHNVKQRPGKPFWFGLYNEKPVFAFPGNAMSVFLCLYRYLLPWVKKSTGLSALYQSAVLAEEVRFSPALQYFLPVKLEINEGRLNAIPVKTNGSGDFTNLLQADAFMELPFNRELFSKGEVYTIWPFKNILHV